MDYRDILGIPKKKPKKKIQKKVIHESPKPSVTNNLEKQFGPLNEWGKVDTGPKRWSKPMDSGLTEFEKEGGMDKVDFVNEGPAGEYAKAYSNVKSTFSDFWDAVGDFQLLLKQKGLRKHQVALKKEWLRVEKFYKFFFKMMDKLQ